MRFCTQAFIQAQIKENIKALRHWPLWGEFSGDRKILPFDDVIMNYASSLLYNHWGREKLAPLMCGYLGCWSWNHRPWTRFLSLDRSKLRLCPVNHRAGYYSSQACDWLGIVWAYSERKTENGPWWTDASGLTNMNRNGRISGLGKTSWCAGSVPDFKSTKYLRRYFFVMSPSLLTTLDMNRD